MNRRLVLWIAAAVIAAHIALFYFLADASPLPKRTFVPPPNFRAREKEFPDPETGGKIVVQEFTVSTRFHEGAPSPEPAKK